MNKKKNTKRSYRRKKKTTYQSVPSGMPRTRRAILRYTTPINILASSGLLQRYLFRANSCYDPDYSGTGHQPMGWDQWTNLFNHYVVVGSKITVRCLTDNANAAPYVFGIHLQDKTTPPYTDWWGYNEAKMGTQKAIKGGTGTTNPTLTCNYSAKKFYNITDIKDNFARIGALTNTDPTEVAYFAVYLQNLTAVSETAFFTVTIDYIVDFSEPKNLALS